MERKTIIIVSIISAILSLVYILFNYFGLLRYAGLYMYPIEGYIKNYKNLDKMDSKNRVVISITATPKQMAKLTPVIKSLLDQTVRVNLISVIIPYSKEYIVPDNLNNAITVFRCGYDHKQLNCLLPTILREGESTTKIITLGAGRVYGKDFIETLLEKSQNFPDKIIYVNSNDYIDLEKGVVFSTSFFNENFLDVPKNMEPNEWVNTYFKNFPKKRIKYSENYKTF